MDHSQQPVVEAWRSEFQRGLTHLRAGAFDDAQACFERAHRLQPDRAEVCYALGRERLRRGDARAAEALLRAAWERDPSFLSAAGTLARCLGLHLGRPDDAYAVLDQAEAHHGPRGLVQVVRSELFLEQDRIDEAREQAEAALGGPDRESVHDAARAALARVCNREGIAHAERGEYETALFWFKRAAGLDPAWSNPHTNLGAALARLGKRDLARQAYERAVAIEPDSALAHYNIGVLLREAGDLDRARESLEQALAHAPMLADAAALLAELYLEDHDPEAAIELLARSLEHSPDRPDLWTHLGEALGARGVRDEAEACLRRALDLDPAYPPACRALADLLVRESRFVEAAVLAQRAQQHSPAGGGGSPAAPKLGRNT